MTRKPKSDRRSPAPSNSRLSLIYGTRLAPVREGEAVEVEVAGRWEWPDVKLVEQRWRRRTRLDGSRGKPFRIDDLVILKLRSTGRIIRTTPWLMSRSLIYRSVQGSLF